jgi:hypothetical protein
MHPTFRSAHDGTDTGTRSATYQYEFWVRITLLSSNTGNGAYKKNEFYDIVAGTGYINGRMFFKKNRKVVMRHCMESTFFLLVHYSQKASLVRGTGIGA